jgi:two-component system nitrate/nitrite response regulator NarL
VTSHWHDPVIPVPSPLIRVLAADSHPLYREGVARVIRQRPALQLVGEGDDASSTLDLLARTRPDVAVVDPAMPGLGASRMLSAIARQVLPTRIVLLAGTVRATEAYDALARGATAYLSKHATGEEIAEAIRRAALGEATIARELQTGVASQIRRRLRSDEPSLSARELQVLALVTDGRTAREIADELMISTSTVRTHLRRACDKLGVHDRAAAVAAAMRLGLLD